MTGLVFLLPFACLVVGLLHVQVMGVDMVSFLVFAVFSLDYGVCK
jgi:hypothetical protein